MTNEKQDRFLTAYKPVHERFERFCRARAYGITDYRDLMNDTLLTAFEKFDTLRSGEAFLGFLFGICVRILANQQRRQKELALSEKEEFIAGAGTGNDADIHFLYEALAQLPDIQRESIILFEIAGFSIREIAEIQRSGESAVKQRLRRGREKLSALLTFESPLITGETHHG